MQRCSYSKYTMAFDTKNAAISTEVMKKLMFDPNISIFDDLDLAVRITLKSRIRYLPAVRVGHFHRSSLKSTIKTHFVRAFWCYRIYRKYKKGNYISQHIMFESMHLKNWVLFPFWMLFHFIIKPPGEAYFILVAELSWRAGVLWSIIKRH